MKYHELLHQFHNDNVNANTTTTTVINFQHQEQQQQHSATLVVNPNDEISLFKCSVELSGLGTKSSHSSNGSIQIIPYGASDTQAMGKMSRHPKSPGMTTFQSIEDNPSHYSIIKPLAFLILSYSI